jgi:SAM-dependent methyltransferase
LSGPRAWPAHERVALRFARGRVLDVGCGAGRHALYLQGRGHEVAGIDISPLAVATAKRRGLRRAYVMGIADLPGGLGRFNTVLLLGANFGLLQSKAKAPHLLGRLAQSTSDGARIIASTLDPYRTREPRHLAYHRANRRRGRLGGQVRLRVRYKDLATGWFDYLFVSCIEMRQLLQGTRWRIGRFIAGGGPPYAAIIEKRPGS